MSGRVTVVGLGPSGVRQMTVEALEVIEAAERLLLRTARHPAAADLAAAGVPFETCDDIYDASGDLGSAYREIAARVMSAAAGGASVVYAVPGSPHVAEATVRLLREQASAAGVELGLVDAMSFLEPVIGAVGADPATCGVVVCDGRRLADQLDAWFPSRRAGEASLPGLLVCQVDTAVVLGEAKLDLLDLLAPGHRVALVLGASTPDAEVRWGPLAELDWGQADPGPLASLWVPPATEDRPGRSDLPFDVGPAHREAGRSFAALVALIDRLRSPGGCPWDADQTHSSLSRHLLEESYEVLDVLDGFPPDAPPARADGAAYTALEEELGDLLMQAVFHARLAEECDAFDAAGVVDTIVAKLVSRHPHVFGDVVVESGAEVVHNWEAIKREEKGRASAVDDVPQALPALARAAKLIRRSAAAGLEWGDAGTAAGRARADTNDVGAALFAVCAWAKALGIDPEESLRAALSRFERSFREAESGSGVHGHDAWDLIS